MAYTADETQYTGGNESLTSPLGNPSTTPDQKLVTSQGRDVDANWSAYSSGWEAASQGAPYDPSRANDPQYAKGWNDYYGYGGTVNAAQDYYAKQEQQKLIDQQNAMLAEQQKRQALTDPVLLAQSGYKVVKDANGNDQLVRLSEEEMMANMTPAEKQQYGLLQQQAQLAQLQYDQALKAQRGEIEIPKWLQDELDKQQMTEQTLINQRLGPAAYLSSAGRESAGSMGNRIANIKSQYAHGEQVNLNQLAGGTLGAMGASRQGLMGGGAYNNQLLGGYGQAASSMPQYAGLYGQYGSQITQGNTLPYAQMAQQQQMQAQANRYGLLGSGLGAIGTGVGMYFGGPAGAAVGGAVGSSLGQALA